MTPREPEGVDEMRRAAAEYVAVVGLRVAAAEIGMSYSGLRTLLAGTEPYPQTVAKLRAWYERHGEVTAEEAEHILSRLVGHLPEGRRPEAVRKLLARIEAESRAAGVEVPEWVRKLQNG